MIHWCENCNVPLLTEECSLCGGNSKYCSSDLKPVFRREKKLYEEVTGIVLPDNLFRNKNRVIYNAETLFAYTINNGDLIIDRNKKEIQKKIAGDKKTFDETIKKTIRANKKHLNEIERKAIGRIRKETNKYNNKDIFISFSGGKDSAVVAYLVKEAFPVHTFPLVFADTDLEFDETIDYAKNFAKKYGFKIIIPKSEKKFFDLFNELGPPSRYMRWCCTTQKAVPFAKFYKNKSNAITFDGIRRKESKTRIGYRIVRKNPKLIKQTNISPIIEWSEFDVWLYGQWKKILQNPLYDYGFSRMGCWMCPNSSDLSIFLTKGIHPELWKGWENALLEYAREHNRDRKWVIENKWRNRKPFRNGENGDDDFSVKVIRPCTTSPIYEYEFTESISEDIIEFLKVFGGIKVSEDLKIARINNENIGITVFFDRNKMTLRFDNNLMELEQYLNRQLIRYLNCVGCGACIGYCPNGAINIINNKFRIDNRKCTHRFKYVDGKYIKDVCTSYNNKKIQKGIKKKKMEGLSPWMARFKLDFNDKWIMIEMIGRGIDTKKEIAEEFGMGVPKIDAYGTWLRYLDLIDIEKHKNKFRYKLTPFCEEILRIKDVDEMISYEIAYYKFCIENEVVSYIVNEFIYKNNEFSTDNIRDCLLEYLEELEGTEKNVKEVTTKYLNALSQNEGFGKLGLLVKPKKATGLWTAHKHKPHWKSFMYILSDYFQRNNISHMKIEEMVTQKNAPGRIFLLNRNDLDDILVELEKRHLISIEMTAGLDQISINHKYSDPYEVANKLIL